MDNRIRDLERLASLGDLAAQAALEQAQKRLQPVKSNREKRREKRASHNPSPHKKERKARQNNRFRERILNEA